MYLYCNTYIVTSDPTPSAASTRLTTDFRKTLPPPPARAAATAAAVVRPRAECAVQAVYFSGMPFLWLLFVDGEGIGFSSPGGGDISFINAASGEMSPFKIAWTAMNSGK